jgi:hypothetical protein
VRNSLDIDPVAEARKFFDVAAEPLSLEKALATVRPGRQIARAAYAGLLLSGRDRFLAETIRAWSDRDDVQAFIGASVTLHGTERPDDHTDPTIYFARQWAPLSAGKHISGTITGLSITNQGIIALGPGEYETNTRRSQKFSEVTVDHLFQLDENLPTARATIEPAITS